MKFLFQAPLALFFLCFFCFQAPLSSQAQTPLTDVALRDDGGYVLMWGRNAAKWDGIPTELKDKILELNKDGKRIKKLALRDDGGYVILWDRNEAQWSGVPEELGEKILDLHKNKIEIKDVALRDDGGYVILYGKNDAQWSGIPDLLSDKIKELHKDGASLKGVSLRNDGGYVLLWGKNEAQWWKVPEKLGDKILDLHQDGKTLKSVDIGDDGRYVIMWGINEAHWNNVPQAVADKILEVFDGNKPAPNPTPNPGPGPSPSGRGKTYAVIVGVAKYNHINSLSYSDDDAYKVYAFLKSPEGGALPDNQIRILIDEDARRTNVLSNLRTMFSKATSNDLILFYFSGHGTKGAFLPFDFDGGFTRLNHSEISTIMRTSKAKHKLIIADACHSGSLDRNLKSANANSVINDYYTALQNSQGGTGTALLMSSKADETSIEFGGIRQGVFSYYLIRGLKGEADKNYNKVVTLSELFSYVNSKTKAYTQYAQNPTLNGSGYDPNMPIGVIGR